MPVPVTTIDIERSRSPEEACSRFLGDVREWAHACVDRYRDEPPTDVHDQLTYTTGWEPYLLATHDERLLEFLASARDAAAVHFAGTGAWRHGYWRMQEAHHGTEHFELFLGFLARVMPGDAATCRQVVDAAEHLGNWSPEVPEWFDYGTGLYRSLFFGADGVRPDEHQLNMPDHMRCANLLLLAYRLTREQRYLGLAATYGQRWAAAICSRPDQLPIGITREGTVYELSSQGEAVYRSFAGMAGLLDTDVDRAENILASGGVQLLLQLWQHTGQHAFLRAARQLLAALVGELADPDAGPVADAIRSHRRLTGGRDYDARVLLALRELVPHDIGTVGVEIVAKRDRRPPGVGKRADTPLWYEDGRVRRHSPVLLAVAAEIEGNAALATRAVDLARAYFALAVRTMPDGRNHGCSAGTVSAVARGHGRDNHAGMTTAVLLPMMQWCGMLPDEHRGGVRDDE